MNSKPRIGITSVFEEDTKRCNVPYPYVKAVYENGGTPLILPHVPEDEIQHQVALLDGILFIGGRDYHARHFNDKLHNKANLMPDKRQDYDLSLYAIIRRKQIPNLCICAGIQLAAIHFGAGIIQDIGSDVPDAAEHKVSGGIEVHPIQIVKNSLLYEIFESDQAITNSSHHQSVSGKNLPKGLFVSSTAEDGIVESIEIEKDSPLDNGSWFLGIQWHPERLTHIAQQQKIFSEFIAHSKIK